MLIREIVFLLTILPLAGCVTTSLPPVGKEPFRLEEDEKPLWQNAEEFERRIAKSDILYTDSELEAYLNAVAQRLVKETLPSEGPKPRVKIIRDPFLNAFTLPNGLIYFHTGMLARLENEAQLATVLAHELSHFIHRHPLRELRTTQNKTTFIMGLNTLLTAVALGAGAYVGAPSLGQLVGLGTQEVGTAWVLASMKGYSRELEAEADEQGLKLMVQAGYDPQEALRAYELSKQELDEQKIKEPFFYGTHPRLEERIENCRRFLETESRAAQQGDQKQKNSEEYLARTHQLLLDNAISDLNINRRKTAQAAVARHLQRQPESARGHFLMGEIHRRSGQNEQAIAAYKKASALDASYADPRRELGLLYRAHKNTELARPELERYLALNPKAPDAPIIKGYLNDLEKP